MKTVNREKTLAYAVAFRFDSSYKSEFMAGSKHYQHVNTVYDEREDGEGYNTLAVVYNFSARKYEVLNVSDEKTGSKEITILNV